MDEKYENATVNQVNEEEANTEEWRNRFMPEELKDMSNTCSFMYKEYYYKAHVEHTMSQKEWEAWYSEHCGKCCYMSVICMYGEK